MTPISTLVTVNGTQYRVPAYQDTGYAQGTGNLSSYLIAIATAFLSSSGGTFTLTADVDFGANFGLKSIYYKSRAATLASTGILRVGNNEVVFAGRNSTDSADLTCTINASNQFAFGGADIKLDAGKCLSLTSPDGLQTIRFGVDNDGNFGAM